MSSGTVAKVKQIGGAVKGATIGSLIAPGGREIGALLGFGRTRKKQQENIFREEREDIDIRNVRQENELRRLTTSGASFASSDLSQVSFQAGGNRTSDVFESLLASVRNRQQTIRQRQLRPGRRQTIIAGRGSLLG